MDPDIRYLCASSAALVSERKLTQQCLRRVQQKRVVLSLIEEQLRLTHRIKALRIPRWVVEHRCRARVIEQVDAQDRATELGPATA